MIRQSNHETQIESRTNVAHRDGFRIDTNDPAQVNSTQVDIHTPEKNIVSKVRSEVDSVMTAVETRVQDAVLTATKKWYFLERNWQ